MKDEKILQSEKLEDEELEKVSGGYSGRVAGGTSNAPSDWKKNLLYNGEEPKNNSESILGRYDGGH